jgi:hypothetical protein
MSKRYTLLLTACIKTTAPIYNAEHRTDVNMRLEDYKTALKYWLHNTDILLDGIVFVENSMYDLSELKQLVEENIDRGITVEFLQNKATEVPEGVHYGYSELEMIDYAFANSTLIKASDYIIKATGRLYFPTVAKLLKRLPSQYNIAIDSRDYDILKYSKHYLVTTIFVVKKEFYATHLVGIKSKMVHGGAGLMEDLYFNILKPMYLEGTKGLILRFPFSMNPVGIGAHWNVNYQSKRKLFESAVRDLSRVLLPKLWI